MSHERLPFFQCVSCGKPRGLLFDFLLQIAKQVGIKEVLNGDVQTVTELLDGNNSSAIASAGDVLNGGLRDATHIAKLIDRNMSLITQFIDSKPDSFAYVQTYHLYSKEMIRVVY